MKTSEPKKILEIKPSPKIDIYVKDSGIEICHYAIDEYRPWDTNAQKMILDMDSAREVAFAIAEYLSKENLK